MSILRAFIWLLLIFAGSVSSRAQQVDPHAIYESKCATCHDAHARGLALGLLEVDRDTVVIPQSGRPLSEFLSRGHGGIGPEEVKDLVEHLKTILSSDQIFATKCRLCHDRAKDFARHELIFQNDRLIGRYTKRDIERFLQHHGRLNQDEIPVILKMLEREASTIPGASN